MQMQIQQYRRSRKAGKISFEPQILGSGSVAVTVTQIIPDIDFNEVPNILQNVTPDSVQAAIDQLKEQLKNGVTNAAGQQEEMGEIQIDAQIAQLEKQAAALRVKKQQRGEHYDSYIADLTALKTDIERECKQAKERYEAQLNETARDVEKRVKEK